MNKHTSIQFQAVDYLIIFSAIALAAISWIYIGLEFVNLPDEIPAHYNFKGEIDRYSGKGILFFVSGLFTLLIAGIYVLARSTSVHNIRLKNKTANFRSIAIFMPYLGIVQAIAIYSMIGGAKQTFEYSHFMLPAILAITLIFIAIMFAIIYKNKKHE